jgi:ribonuclease HII
MTAEAEGDSFPRMDASIAAPIPTPRSRSVLAYERELWDRGLSGVAGIDEVGRGPLAGPVVAAAVVLRPGCRPIRGVDDSKKLSREERETAVGKILGTALAVGIGAASVREIDRLNIRCATALAMRRAILRLGMLPEHLLVDGLPVPELGLERQTAVVGGDRRVHSIACASILAKVTRDRLMARLAPRYPGYHWESNKGYGTPEHMAGIHRTGPTPHHRTSFRPVIELTLPL